MRNKLMKDVEIIKDTVWKISITDEYGRNVVLVSQPKEPTQAQLDKLGKKWKKEFDIEDDSEYPYVEISGQIYKDRIPTMKEYLQQEDC